MEVVGGFISGWTQIWHFKILIIHRPWRALASRRLPCCWFHYSAVSFTHGHWTRPPWNIIGLYDLQLAFKSVRRPRRHNQMQSHMVISIAYCIGMKEDHQTLLSFVVLAGKWQKRTFWYKVVFTKIFMVGPKGGGHRTVPPFKYATGKVPRFYSPLCKSIPSLTVTYIGLLKLLTK